MTTRQVLRYYCSKCQSVLKESLEELAASPSDICPQCGSFLSETLCREAPKTKVEMPEPKPALDMSVPSFGMSELDCLGMRYSSSVCLTGKSSELLFWRALVRSLLPVRAGGSGFSKVLLVDAGNCSDIYLCVDYARQMGMSLDVLLDGIVVSRAFTVYQLAALASDLGSSARRFGTQLVAVADMAKMFARDPQIAGEESKMSRKIAGSIAQVSRHVPVIAFMSSFRSAEWLAAFESVVQVEKVEGRLLLSARKGSELRSAAVKESNVLLVRQS